MFSSLPTITFRSNTLFRKLVTSVILVAVPLITVVVGVILWFNLQAFERVTGVQQLELARQTMDKIDRLLYERYNDIASIGEEVMVEQYTEQEVKVAPNQASGSAGKQSQPSQMTVTKQNLNRRMGELMVLTGPWESLEIASPSGKVLFSTLNKTPNTTFHQEYPHLTELFSAALKNQVVYSDVIIDERSNKQILVFMAPIRAWEDPKHPVIGVVIGHLSWRAVFEVLQNVRASSVELFNKDGAKIGDESIFQVLNSAEAQVTLTRSLAEIKDATEHNQIISAPDKPEVLVSHIKQPGFLSFKGLDWSLVISTPTSQAFIEAYQVSGLLVILMVALLVSLLTALFLVVRNVVIGPVDALTKTSLEIAAGNLHQRVVVTSQDEVGQLGTAFNQMAEKLEDIYKNLEQKVEEKVAELAAKVKELSREKAQDEAILKSIGEGLIALDNQGQIILTNQKALDMLGIALDSVGILGKKPQELFSIFAKESKPDDAALSEEQRPEQQVLNTGKSFEAIFIVKPTKDTHINVSVNAQPILDQEQVLGVIMAMKDVTHEQEVDRMKTEFISLASHQLRTPLSAINWFSEMLLSGDAGELNAEQKDFTQNIADSTTRMVDLVNSLLNISRIESGRIMIQPAPTDLKELVQSIVNDLKAKIEEKQHTLAISVHQDLPMINLDKQLIGQVYLNLLTNAIKYTPKNGEISVFISRKDDQVVSQVTDSGYGIPKSEHHKVFQKFFRADNVAKVETDGTGLGLYLVKAIIESSGGKIWFESEEGKGTTFWFSLPMTGMQPKKGEVTLDS